MEEDVGLLAESLDADDWLVQAIANRDSPAARLDHTSSSSGSALPLSFTPPGVSTAHAPRTPSRLGPEAALQRGSRGAGRPTPPPALPAPLTVDSHALLTLRLDQLEVTPSPSSRVSRSRGGALRIRPSLTLALHPQRLDAPAAMVGGAAQPQSTALGTQLGF
jgi:hypothetical protein